MPYSESVNMIFVCANLMEDCLKNSEHYQKIEHKFKFNVKQAISYLRKINQIAENMLTPDILVHLDNDRDLVEYLCCKFITAEKNDKLEQFIEHINKFNYD